MSEEDDQSALVALTKRQIQLIIIMINEDRPMRQNFRQALQRAKEQLQIALYALSQEQ